MEFNNADGSRLSVNGSKNLQNTIGTNSISKEFWHPPVEIYGRKNVRFCRKENKYFLL